MFGLSEVEARRRLIEVISAVSAKRIDIATQRGDVDIPQSVLVHSKHAVTLVGFSGFRPVQFVLRIYRSPSEILLGFDVDCCCVGLTVRGSSVVPYASPRAWRALVTRANAIDTTRRSPSYEQRLEKYARRGFGVFLYPGFNRSLVDKSKVLSRFYYAQPSGFESLLLSDTNPTFSLSFTRPSWSIESAPPADRYGRPSGRPSRVIASDYCNDSQILRSLRWFDFSSLSKGDVSIIFKACNDAEGGKELPVSASVSELAFVRTIKVGPAARHESVTLIRLQSDRELDGHLGPLFWITENPGQQMDATGSALLMSGSFQPSAYQKPGDWIRAAEWATDATTHVRNSSIATLLLGRCTGSFLQPGGKKHLAAVAAERDRDFYALIKRAPKKVGWDVYDGTAAIENSVYKVLKQIHPDLEITANGMSFLNLFVAKMYKLFIKTILNNLLCGGKKKTISSKEVQTAIRLILPGELAMHAVAQGSKAFYIQDRY